MVVKNRRLFRCYGRYVRFFSSSSVLCSLYVVLRLFLGTVSTIWDSVHLIRCGDFYLRRLLACLFLLWSWRCELLFSGPCPCACCLGSWVAWFFWVHCLDVCLSWGYVVCGFRIFGRGLGVRVLRVFLLFMLGITVPSLVISMFCLSMIVMLGIEPSPLVTRIPWSIV